MWSPSMCLCTDFLLKAQHLLLVTVLKCVLITYCIIYVLLNILMYISIAFRILIIVLVILLSCMYKPSIVYRGLETRWWWWCPAMSSSVVMSSNVVIAIQIGLDFLICTIICFHCHNLLVSMILQGFIPYSLIRVSFQLW